MTIIGAIIIYLVLWWVILFTILPLKIKSQLEENNIYKGSEPGAPSNPNLKYKLYLTTLLTTVLFALIYIINYLEIFDIRDFFIK